MAEVGDGLRRIEHWDQHARSLALSPDALASIDALQRRAIDRIRISEENDRIRVSQQDLAKTVTSNICDWLQAELTKTADLLRATYEVEVSAVAENSDFRFGAEPPFGRKGPQVYVARGGRQLAFIDKSATFKQKCVLTAKDTTSRFEWAIMSCHWRIPIRACLLFPTSMNTIRQTTSAALSAVS